MKANASQTKPMTPALLRAQRERLTALEPWRIRIGGGVGNYKSAEGSSPNRAAAPLARAQVMKKGVCDETADVF